MDADLKKISDQLRAMPSNQAADWLIQQYPTHAPDWWRAFQLMPHLSWKRPDQLRLARYYLQRIPFASDLGYKVFASFMSVGLLVDVIRENLPKDRSNLDLLLYYLEPVLERAAKSEKERKLIKEFVVELKEAPSNDMASAVF